MRAVLATLAVLASACAPGPQPMAATEASEILARFAAGAAPVDLCTPEGRSVLRGAVRAYGAAMHSGGVPWPAAPDGEPTAFTSVEAAVLVAQWAGFVEAADLRGQADPSAVAALPELRALRGAALSACDEAARLQRAAAQLALEAERYRWLNADAQRNTIEAADLERQARRLARAQAQLHMAVANLGG